MLSSLSECLLLAPSQFVAMFVTSAVANSKGGAEQLYAFHQQQLCDALLDFGEHPHEKKSVLDNEGGGHASVGCFPMLLPIHPVEVVEDGSCR